jgi:hypothetical protein
MAAGWNLYLAFCLMTETNEILALGVWNTVFRLIINITANSVWTIFSMLITNITTSMMWNFEVIAY